MADRTGIEWADATWNPLRARNRATGRLGWHCTHVTDACRNCYAEALNRRLGTGLPFKPGHEADVALFLDEKMLTQPLRWQRPRTIFVCSTTDLFADFVRDDWIDRVFTFMAVAPRHRFLVLTKRPERMHDYVRDFNTRARVYADICDLPIDGTADAVLIAPGMPPDLAALAPPGPQIQLDRWPLPNVWLGTSVHDQASANRFIPPLLATPAARRFLSAEPLLGAIDLGCIPFPAGWPRDPDGGAEGIDALRHARARLDWVVAGGESGQASQQPRPLHPDWVRALRDQCTAAGTPFHFKQWGDWQPRDRWPTAAERVPSQAIDRNGNAVPDDIDPAEVGGQIFARTGKKPAGRTLDGRTHEDMPA